MPSFFSSASYKSSINFMKVELSASATASATSSISKDDAYKIAYDLAKKKGRSRPNFSKNKISE